MALRSATRIMLSLGSNKAFSHKPPEDLLEWAVKKLGENGLSNIKKSTIHRTKPMYFPDQNDFCNMVVIADFSGSALELLSITQGIESGGGRDRRREIHNGPRTLDIDIIFFGDQKINISVDCTNSRGKDAGIFLVVPHPHWRERDFVKIPALEILDKTADAVIWRLMHE